MLCRLKIRAGEATLATTAQRGQSLRALEITKVPLFVIASEARRSIFAHRRHRLPRCIRHCEELWRRGNRNDGVGTFAFSASLIQNCFKDFANTGSIESIAAPIFLAVQRAADC